METGTDAVKFLRDKRSNMTHAQLKARRKKKGQYVDIIAKQVYQEHSYAMISCEAIDKNSEKDFTLFLVYDHRQNDKLEQISKRLF